MSTDKLIQIEKMLTALLRSNDQLHWVGGYAHGRTSNDDPFLILYPASEKLNHKVCRVYPQDFKKLPAFVNTDVLPGLAQDGNPDRDKAIKKGIYHACPAFLITTYAGKETQMGNEVRFMDVIRVSKEAATVTPETNPAPGEHACAWCHAQPALPGEPCEACRKLGATPENKPTPPPVATPTPIPELTARQKQLRALYDYAKSKGMSKGAVDLEMARFDGNPVDTLHALQAEHGDRPEPPAHQEVTMQEYWHAVYNVQPRWSQQGGSELLKQFHNNPTLAYQEVMAKKGQANA